MLALRNSWRVSERHLVGTNGKKTHVKVKQKRFNGGETWPSKIGTNVNFNGQKGKIISEMVDAASHVNWFFDEAGYRLSATSLRWISISP